MNRNAGPSIRTAWYPDEDAQNREFFLERYDSDAIGPARQRRRSAENQPELEPVERLCVVALKYEGRSHRGAPSRTRTPLRKCSSERSPFTPSYTPQLPLRSPPARPETCPQGCETGRSPSPGRRPAGTLSMSADPGGGPSSAGVPHFRRVWQDKDRIIL